MKIKIHFFNKLLLRSYLIILGAISTITSLVIVFLPMTVQLQYIGVIFAMLLIFIYIGLWIYANCMKCISLTINNSKVDVKVGDIFKEEGLKVIAFNEYFDTIVNEEIIASSSLNGKYINQYVNDVNLFDKNICENKHLLDCRIENNIERTQGNTQKYKLGSIYKNDEYLLTAFSKFDEQNRSFLTINDYINCLMNFWNEIDIIYANRTVVIPLLGTGITRGCDFMLEQDKLELLLWSFKVSRIKFTYPAKVIILIHESIKDKINFYKLKEV
ncbi:MAG: DUF6430 domain-containing protein [Oscillospiraceae bacterium]|nr:DUF6430 domain-containing protein [Oscillospiraceae bacterium]